MASGHALDTECNIINNSNNINNNKTVNKIINDKSIQDILRMLPHRYPFLLVDKVLEVEPGVAIKALKNVSTNENFFTGHFPDYPVMPGVLILEAMAQTSALLIGYSMENNCFKEFSYTKDGLFLFAGINNVRFKKVVLPGDQLIIESKLERFKKEITKFSSVVRVDDKIVCQAELLSAYRDKKDLN